VAEWASAGLAGYTDDAASVADDRGRDGADSADR
jgi:hypothetical protein